MIAVMFPGTAYYSKEIRIKLERDANISPQGVYKIVHFLLLTEGLLSLFVAIPKLRGLVVVIKDARDFQNLISFPPALCYTQNTNAI